MIGSQSILQWIGTGLSTALIIGFLYFWMTRTRDRNALIVRLVATGLVIGFWFIAAYPSWRAGGRIQIFGLLVTVACGWMMAIIWARAMAGALGDLIGSIYDGGQEEADPKPVYSTYHSKRAKGKFFEAQAELRKQLDRFPTDFEGMMLLAELQAENLNDLPGAEVTVLRLCSQPGHADVNIAYALNHLADWHLSLTKDRDAAQRSLEKIIELLPDTQLSLQASQRIAHLASTDLLLAPIQREPMALKKGAENIGLMRDRGGRLKPREVDQGAVAAGYVTHLEQHPLDTEIREKLAVLYASHYHRLDLALDQLEQMVQQPNHPPKQVVHWLNTMTDLQVQEGAPLEQVRDTLQRIVDLYPDIAAAAVAQRRLDIVNLELKTREKVPTVPMGNYEQNVGLKRRR